MKGDLRRKLQFAICGIALCGSLMGQILPPSDDAHVNGAYPTSNFGALPYLQVGSMAQAFVRFDLSSLPASLTASTVSSASLFLWVNRVGVAGSMQVSEVTGAWTEETITWNSQPSVDSAFGTMTASTGDQFVWIDVTNAVKDWIATPADNQGLAIAGVGSTAIFLDSKESVTTSHEPQLQIVPLQSGAQGPSGQTGIAGPAGPAGPTGLTGSAGPQGVAGASGLAGANGTVGPAGPTSPAITFSASVLNPTTVASFFFAPNAAGDATVGGRYVAYSSVATLLPVSCVFDSLEVNPSAVAAGFGSGGQITVTLYVNGASSSLTATGNSLSGSSGAVTGASVSVTAGSSVAFQASGAGLTSGQDILNVSAHCH